jgi:hypothetical protein
LVGGRVDDWKQLAHKSITSGPSWLPGESQIAGVGL